MTLSYPKIRTFLAESFAKIVQNGDTYPDVIAGVATGAIAVGMLVAQQLGLPFVYVRPEPKSHGRGNQIEGCLQAGQKVVVIEDLISTGGSSLGAVAALREAGAQVLYMAAIMTYGFSVAQDNFEKAGVRLTTLCDYDTLNRPGCGDALRAALRSGIAGALAGEPFPVEKGRCGSRRGKMNNRTLEKYIAKT